MLTDESPPCGTEGYLSAHLPGASEAADPQKLRVSSAPPQRRKLDGVTVGSGKPDTGIDLRDLLAESAFRMRPRQPRDPNRCAVAFRQLSRLIAEDADSVIQELVNAAVNFCGADSAGISLEEPETETFRWVAVAGSFAPYLDGRTPRDISPCGICVDSGRPQLFRVTQPYYDLLGIAGEPVTDGILIPWASEFLRGTLWAVSHSSAEAFDFEDYVFLSTISDFASIILSQQARQRMLRDAEQARANADERLRRMMETEAVGILFFTREGTIIDANDVFLKMVGYTREELTARLMSWRDLTPPEWMAASEEQMQRFAATGRIGPYEKEYFRKDGSRRWMLFAGRDLGDGTIGEYAIDISDRRRAEAALVRTEKLATLGRLSASIAHEINNPLEAMTNLLYLARQNEGVTSGAGEYLLLAEAELRRVAHIARQSLGFYRESATPTDLSVPQLIDSTLDLLHSKIAIKNAHIECQWDEDVKMHGVAGELRQVFSNLLANSLDAIEDHGCIVIRVTRLGNGSGGTVRVTFADSGSGIQPNQRASIFDPFFSTKQEQGNGLGLWVTRQIIEKHRGSIRMRSCTTPPNRGTTFSITFPA